MIILLTGKPGAGKSTVIEAFLNNYHDPVKWVLTKEIRDINGMRLGFSSISSLGDERLIAHKTNISSSSKVGDYHLDIEAIDQFFGSVLKNNKQGQLVVLDEIGLMQFHSSLFKSCLDEAFEDPDDIKLIATINFDDPVFNKYRDSKDALCIEVTDDNRDQLPAVLLYLIQHYQKIMKLKVPQRQIVIRLLSKFIQANETIQVGKLLNNALDYVLESRISNDGEAWNVRGRHGNYEVTEQYGELSCTCDLFNGRGKYEAGECSHIMAAMIFSAA